MLKTPQYRSGLVSVAVDEVHVAVHWSIHGIDNST